MTVTQDTVGAETITVPVTIIKEKGVPAERTVYVTVEEVEQEDIIVEVTSHRARSGGLRAKKKKGKI